MAARLSQSHLSALHEDGSTPAATGAACSTYSSDVLGGLRWKVKEYDVIDLQCDESEVYSRQFKQSKAKTVFPESINEGSESADGDDV